MRKVNSNLYNKEYFLNAVEGYQNFDNFMSNMNPKFKKALKMANLKKGDRVLDFGCGRGEISFYANLLYGCESVGTDYSADAIAVCNEALEKIDSNKKNKTTFLLFDNNKLPFESNSFDAIFFLDVWEHIYPEQIDELLAEFNRILKNDGRLIIHTCPNKVFFNVGFPKYTYYINNILNKLVFMPFYGKEMKRSKIDPRSDYEKSMHINEQSVESVRASLKKKDFHDNIYNDDYFSMFSGWKLFSYYLIAQPFYLPFMKNLFSEHIWGVARKNNKIKVESSDKYLTIPNDFSSDDYYRFRKLNDIICDILKRKNIKDITFLDIGCGDGQFMKYVDAHLPKELKINFIGIDKYVVRKSFDFQLLNDDVERKINLPSKTADIIVCAEIIEHLKNTDQFIQEAQRILKDDGDLIITTPNLASYLNRFLLLFGYQPYHAEVSEVESGFGLGIVYGVLGRSKINNKTAGHLRMFTFRALRDFVEYYGLRIEKFYPVYLSTFRKDNKRVGIIKAFFFIDYLVSKVFPKMANGLIFHLRKKYVNK